MKKKKIKKINLGKEINKLFTRKAGPMKHRCDKRKNKNSWRDDEE